MPMNRKLYPPNWNAIALQIKESANLTCQNCSRPCRKPKVAWVDFVQWLLDQGKTGWYDDTSDYISCDETGEWGYKERPHRFTLTVAHLNHKPEDCSPENLKALCFPCHARYDTAQMKLKKRLKAERLGQLTLL
jgi:hypothetical protein